MEGERRRSKRKPLSNITNTLHHINNNNINKNNNNNNKPFSKKPFFKNPFSTPRNSNTSTGSNHSLNSGGTACRNSRVTVDPVHTHETTSKDKGKMVTETNALQISSSASRGFSSHSETQVVQHQNVQVLKDKGKFTEDASVIHSPALLTSEYVHMSSSGCSLSEPSPVQSQKSDEERRKAKGKMVAESPTIQLSASFTTNTQQVSSSASPGHSSHSGTQAVQNQDMHVQINKGKGKITKDAPIIHSPDLFTSKFPLMSSSGCSLYETAPVRRQKLDDERRKDNGKKVSETPIILLSESNTMPLSSSATPDHSSHYGAQDVPNQDMQVQAIKDKGKITEDAPAIDSPAIFTSKYLHMSSSGCSLSETTPVPNQNLDEERRKAKGKLVLGTSNMEASELLTPHTPVVSFADSGTLDRPLTDYNQRRPQRRRKHAADKINFPLSCPPDQRSKKTGLELNSDSSVNKSGSHTDPLPVRKKKRSRDKYQLHVMPKEEVEKLKTYYADIDAFELPVEEVASENELE